MKTLQDYIDKLNKLNFKEMYNGDFFLTWEKTDEELEAVFTVADALRFMRENNISTKVFESGLGISLFRDNAYGHIRMSGRLDLCPVKFDQGCSCGDRLAFLHQILEAIPLHIHRIDADVQQEFHAVIEPQSAGMAGIGHHDGDFCVGRRVQRLIFRDNCQSAAHDAFRKDAVAHFLQRDRFSG